MDLAIVCSEFASDTIWDLTSSSEQDYRQAASLLEPIVRDQPGLRHPLGAVRAHLASTYSNLGMVLAIKGRRFEAEPLIRSAIVLCQNEEGWGQDVLASSYTKLAIVRDLGGQFAEADDALAAGIKVRKQVVESFPNSAFFRGELSDDLAFCARLKLKTGRPNEAEDAYREAIALWNDVAEIFRHDHVRDLKIALINLLRNMGRADEALLMANELPGQDADDLLARARTYETLEDHIRALADHQQAIQLQEKLAVDFPNAPERRAQLNSGYALLGELLQRTGKLDDAEQCFRKAVALSEKLTTEFAAEAYYWRQYCDSHMRLAKLLAATGRPDEASVCFREAIRICRDVFQCNDLAWRLATSPDTKLRDPAAAVEGARKATELEPEAGACWNTLGVALYRNGDWTSAITALDKSRHLRNGGDSFDWFFLGMANWHIGEKEKAQDWVRQAIEWMDINSPKDEELLRFRAEAEELMGLKEKQ